MYNKRLINVSIEPVLLNRLKTILAIAIYSHT